MSVDEKIYYTEDDDEKIVYTEEDDRKAMNEERNTNNSSVDSDSNLGENEKKDNKILMTIGYFSFLFIIPMLVESCKKDEFIRHHVNQSIWLFIYGVFTSAVKGIFDFVFTSTGLKVFEILSVILSSALSAVGLLLLILQLVALWQDQKREIPLVGKIKIYK